MSVVVVHHMEETESAPRHPLNQPLSEMVECHSDLHFLVLHIIIGCAKQEDLNELNHIIIFTCMVRFYYDAD